MSTQDFFVFLTAVIDEEVEVGKDSKIGERCNIGQNVVLGPDVCIGDGCKIQNNDSLYEGDHS